MKFDYSDAPNETAARAAAKKDLVKLFFDFCVETFGEDKVRMTKDGIGFVFGDIKDRDGFLKDFCAVINPVAKSYQDHVGPKRTYLAYNLYQEAEDYENGIEE